MQLVRASQIAKMCLKVILFIPSTCNFFGFIRNRFSEVEQKKGSRAANIAANKSLLSAPAEHEEHLKTRLVVLV